jgi:hypothetical protein
MILKDPGTAKARNMSTAGHVVLLVSGLSVAGCVMSSGTDTSDLLDQVQGGQGSNSPSLGSSPISHHEAPSPSLIEPTIVTIVERPVERSVALGQLLNPRGRDAIGRELQKELKRVGCYAGELNGAWTKSTRQAMKVFTDRVNAKLPIDKPDDFLLALVVGYPNKVCGVPCPSGQSLSRTQQCIPDVLLARSGRTKLTASRKPTHVTNARTVTTTVASGVSVPPGWTEHPDDVAPGEPSSPSAGIPHKRSAPRRVMKKHWQSPARHERAWASDFFRHRDRFSLY